MNFLVALGRNSCFGVSIFFAISGFLITTTSIQRFGSLGTIDLKDFYVFRAARILPLLVLLTALNFLGRYGGFPGFELSPDVSTGKLLFYLYTFRFNILYLNGGAALAVWAVLWSLAVEEVFYLGYPLLCRILRRDVIIIGFLSVVVVAGPIMRSRNGWSGMYAYDGCFDQIALGCLGGIAAARLANRPWFIRRAAPIVTVVGAVLTMVIYFAQDAHVGSCWVWGPSAIAVGAALFSCGTSQWMRWMPGNPFWQLGRGLRLLGILSYELYLFHTPLFLLFRPDLAFVRSFTTGTMPRDIAFVALLPAIVVLGWMIAEYVGRPAHRMIRAAV